MGNKKTSDVWKLFNQVKVNGKEVAVAFAKPLWFHLKRDDGRHKEEYAALKPQKQPSSKRRRTSHPPAILLDVYSCGEGTSAVSLLVLI
ncbi:hypothetical protein GHT06_003260 [Daphnia sinensis]|uniref:Uncharacterized protein n=1 Tax=Daphnia sinensis TaxID=1820382 RepID=A0AAD5L5E1_9CRUS|nr:hypothetical protein GHT06_003260 [Daphnia sinensis]